MHRYFLLLLLCLPALRAETYVARGTATEWAYSTGPAIAAEWKTAGFDDKTWARGKAPLGFGDDGLSTEIKPAAPAGVTYWFRHSFTAAKPGTAPLRLILRTDDGAAVYLNGVEIARVNLAPDAGPATPALKALSEPEEALAHSFTLKDATLQKGQNVLAVEVHQSSARSSDLWLDLALLADDRRAEGTAKISEAARESTLAYYQNHFVPPGMKIADGYVDGGRRMVLSKDSAVLSSREILVVDRAADPALRAHLEKAKDPAILALLPEERARALARRRPRGLARRRGSLHHGLCEPPGALWRNGESLLRGRLPPPLAAL
jgi:hypothetical protein